MLDFTNKADRKAIPKPITINFQFCISSLTKFLREIEFKINETGGAKWQKNVKLKSRLPTLALADFIYFS